MTMSSSDHEVTTKDFDSFLDEVAEAAVGSVEDYEAKATALKSAETLRNEAKEQVKDTLRMDDLRKSIKNGLEVVADLMPKLVSQPALDQLIKEVDDGMAALAKGPQVLNAKEGLILQELFGISNDSMMNIYDMGSQLIKEKEFQTAREVFTISSLLAPDISAHWTALALCYQETEGTFEEINGMYEMAAALAPEDAEVLIRWAAYLIEENHKSEARDCLDRAEPLLTNEMGSGWRKVMGSLRHKLA